jgi:hypothetical protein
LIRPFVTDQEIEQNPYRENTEAQRIAALYNESLGFPPPQPTPYVEVNPAVSRQIAQIFQNTPNMAFDPVVREAYAALVNEVDAQFAVLPIKIIPVGGDNYPYKASPEMMDDVLQNGRMFVFDGGDDHAILTREQNFKFRAVHDYFGHSQHGFAFGPRGEENAWIEHSKMFSPVARQALTTETRGQNSWVNFGPYSHLPVTQRPYAEQKVFILPIQFLTHPVLEEAYREYPGFYPTGHMYRNPVKLVGVKPGRHMIKSRETGESVYQGTLFDVEKPKLPRKRKEVTWCLREQHLSRLRRYFKLGQDGLHWYDSTYPEIVEFFNNDVPRANTFVYLLAATSPLCNIRENIKRALKALYAVEHYGATITVVKQYVDFPAHQLNVLRAVRGEPLEGPKVTAFAKNLFGPDFRDESGNIKFPDAADVVTVDRWVMRAVMGNCPKLDGSGSEDDDAPTGPQYRCIEDAVRKLAYEAGVQPRQYQAAIWVGIKRECGDEEVDTTNPFNVELRTVADKISQQKRFDFDFDPEFSEFERGLESVIFYEGRRNPDRTEELMARILDTGDGEFILDTSNVALERV